MPVYRPRMAARLFVPNVGTPSERTQQEQLDDVTELQVRVHRARWESNNHNEADELEIEIAYDDAGIDPRFLSSAEVYFYLGDGDAKGEFTAGLQNQRFVGIACDVERVLSESSGKNIRIRALDYTTLFLTCKTFPPEGIPDLSQTLGDAWRRVCDHTGIYDLATKSVVSSVARLRDRIQFIPEDLGSLVLGQALPARLRKLGKLQVKARADAWGVWQTAVGSLGLVSFIRGDRCIVTTATDYYTATDPPRFVWGLNVLELRERRDVLAFNGKNVGIISINPLTGKTIEAYWPPLEYVQQKKRLGASALGSPFVVRAQDYEIFDCPLPISDENVLEAFAKRVWEERSRQELGGNLSTREMFTDTLSGASMDLLKLQSGDRIRVEVDRDALTVIQRLPSIYQRIVALRDRGYSVDMARYIVKNLDAIVRVSPEFQVHSVDVELNVTQAPGSYDMNVRFLNRIDVSGSAQPGTGPTSVTPITGQTRTVPARAEKTRNGRA